MASDFWKVVFGWIGRSCFAVWFYFWNLARTLSPATLGHHRLCCCLCCCAASVLLVWCCCGGFDCGAAAAGALCVRTKLAVSHTTSAVCCRLCVILCCRWWVTCTPDRNHTRYKVGSGNMWYLVRGCVTGRPGGVSGYPRAWYRSVSWVQAPPSA